ncbi:MAG TPA: ribonuclease III [Candidatus Butyricicoccus avistercoris]|uniref:Mini-ribonuclease 3 n=1 Tax=Candidatus Butyricicoccus avistercoris TaxID=2838518 RepID=A0A9D1PI83_9FIRM|nr:ribonuclease III [Candidatus Butyricicoccus avistercoris]
MNTDFLHPHLSDAEILQVSSLGLAHIGDVVYEIMTRSYIVCHGTQTAKNLHAKTVSLVRASAQYTAAQKIIPLLTEEEQDVFKRARNTKLHGIPKAASRSEYAHATALEALFGWLYLKKQYDRLNELYSVISEDFNI